SLCLRAGRGHHRGGGRADRQHAIVPALYRLRLRHRHVRRRRAGRARQHPRRVLGRADHRRRAADVDARPALSAAEHRDLRGLPAHRVFPAERHFRPRRRARLMRSRSAAAQVAAIFLFSAAYLLLGLIIGNAYYQLIMTLVLLWATLGLAWNMLSGYSGLISFGHAVFFGLGGYTMTIVFVKYGLTPWLGIPLGVVVGVLAGVVIGLATFRLRGHYFALSMLAYPLAMLYVFEWLGYQEVALPMMRERPASYAQFSDPRAYMALSLALMVVCMLVSLKVERSRFGLSLRAIKQDEAAAEAAGVDALAWKMRAMILSAAMAAAAGGLYAVVILVVTPQSMFGMLVSAQALVVTLFGGVGVLWGPVIGAVILVPLAEALHAELGNIIPGIQGVVYGIAIIVIILSAPEGIYWRIHDRLAARRVRERAPPAARAPEQETAGFV